MFLKSSSGLNKRPLGNGFAGLCQANANDAGGVPRNKAKGKK